MARARRLHVDDEQFRGLYISEQELDALLKQPIGRPRWYQATRDKGIELRLDAVQQIFQLNDFECNVLLICLAIELDLRYERLYAYLQDDVTKKKPGVDLVLNLLQFSAAEKLKEAHAMVCQS